MCVYVRKNVFVGLFSVHSIISLHVMNERVQWGYVSRDTRKLSHET